MKKHRRILSVAASLGALVWVVGGCAGGSQKGALACRYQPGSVETVKFTTSSVYKNWVEMPGKPADQVRSRQTDIELVLTRHVEEVSADGSAVLKVTFEKAAYNVKINFPDKQTDDFYMSTPQETRSSKDEPMLGGRSYKIRIAPDTTVLEILERDELLRQLGLTPDQDSGIAIHLISEELIKQCHQRQFVQHSPTLTKPKKVVLPLPDLMIKAKAIEKTFTAGPVESRGGAAMVKVTTTGAPVHQLPEGFAEPGEPKAFGQKLILDNSDMQELKIEGESLFDLAGGQIHHDRQSLQCFLVLLGDKLFGGKGMVKPGSGGEMFTEVKLAETFERLE